MEGAEPSDTDPLYTELVRVVLGELTLTQGLGPCCYIILSLLKLRMCENSTLRFPQFDGDRFFHLVNRTRMNSVKSRFH